MRSVDEIEAAVRAKFVSMGIEPTAEMVADAVRQIATNVAPVAMVEVGRDDVSDDIYDGIMNLTNDILVVVTDQSPGLMLNAMTAAAVSVCRSLGVPIDAFLEGCRKYNASCDEACDRVELRRDS